MSNRRMHNIRVRIISLFGCLLAASVLGACSGASDGSKTALVLSEDAVPVEPLLADNGDLFETVIERAVDGVEESLYNISIAKDEQGDDTVVASDSHVEEEEPDEPEEVAEETVEESEPSGGKIQVSETVDLVITQSEPANLTTDENGNPTKYYDLAPKSEETTAAVSDVVMQETGGQAGYITSYQNKIIELVNIERAKLGLTQLVWDSGAQQVANIRAMEIVGHPEHTRPNGSPWYSLFSPGFPFTA